MLPCADMPPIINTRSLYTVNAAARALRITRQAVWLAVSAGRLKTTKVAGVEFITRESVQEYRRTRHPGGRPKR